MTMVSKTRSDWPVLSPTGSAVVDTSAIWCVGLVGLGLLGWLAALLVMTGMDQGPGTPLHELPVFLIGWIIMLTAMMLPSEIKYVRVLAQSLQHGAVTPWRRLGHVASFVSGYGVAWIAYGMLAFVLDAVLRESAAAFLSWDRAGPLLAGSVLGLAGVYQVSPLKQACLTHCRSPLSYFARHWRPGSLGALRMGISHGLVCVGCCWALMAVMFAVGAMSLTWMGLLALLMFAEKIFPFGHRLAYPIAIFLWLMGLWIAVAPDTAPLLTDSFLFGGICRALL